MSPESKQAYFDNLEKQISLHGFSTISVKGKTNSFSYTVGLHKSYNHPEMIVFGLPPETAHGVLSDIADKAKAGDAFDLSKPTDELFSNCRAYFVEVPPDVFSEYVLSAIHVNDGENFAVFQIVWPSGKDGLYPWDPDSDPHFVVSQPVLNPKR